MNIKLLITTIVFSLSALFASSSYAAEAKKTKTGLMLKSDNNSTDTEQGTDGLEKVHTSPVEAEKDLEAKAAAPKKEKKEEAKY